MNRLLSRGLTIHRAHEPLQTAGVTWPPGAFIVPASGDARRGLEESLAELELAVVGLETAPTIGTGRLRAPRVGLYRA